MKENIKDSQRNLRYLRKEGTRPMVKRGGSISKKLGSWLRTLFPKKGQVFASPDALRAEKYINNTIATHSESKLWAMMVAYKAREEYALNPVDKAIYKRLRRRLRNRLLDLKEKE